MISDLTNTEWLINETPMAASEAISYNNLTFTSCGIEYNSISLDPSIGITYDSTKVANAINNKYSFSIRGYRLIHFTDAVEGGTSDLIDWLIQNAKRVRSYNLFDAHLDEDKEDAYRIAVSTYNDVDETEQTKINYIPQEWPYLIFRSENSFTLSINNSTKYWNGTLEYSTDKETWSEWDGTTTITAQERANNKYYIYLRGTNNTHLMTSSASNGYWVLNGTNIECLGNIGMLLDYHKAQFFTPSMDTYCFYSLFKNCTGLISAPVLPAKTLTWHCYQSMFEGCTGLVTAPILPAQLTTTYCYHSMFKGCTSLTTAPTLPAWTLASHCYQSMFENCTGLTSAPALPAQTLITYCYHSMFKGCTGLTAAPALSSSRIATYCYYSMFEGCTNLTTAPVLPALNMVDYCYHSMFKSCTSLRLPPALPGDVQNHCYQSMFEGCTSLTTLPILPSTILAMYCYRSMFNGCSTIKLAKNQEDEYVYPFRMPPKGIGVWAPFSLGGMFDNTGGTFHSDPNMNVTYYTNNKPIS